MNEFRSDHSRRRLLGLGGLLVAGGLAGCGSTDGTPTPSESGEWTTHTHGRYGYSLKLPSSWSVEEDVTVDGTDFATVVSIPDGGEEIGRLYVQDVVDADPTVDVVETFVAASVENWETVEVDEITISDGRSRPIATLETADYLHIRWLSVFDDGTRFDVVPAVWTDALDSERRATLATVLESFTPPAAPDAQERLAAAAPAGTPSTAPGDRPVRHLRPSSQTVGMSRAVTAQAEQDADPCASHEGRLREINREANRLESEQETNKRGFDSALDGLLNGFEETSGEGLPGLARAFDLIVVLCNLVGGFTAAHGRLREEQRAISDRRFEAAGELRECRRENPDSAPGQPRGEVTAITRSSVTLDLENVPMDVFSIRFVTDDGDGVERLEHVGPIEAPGGQFSGTVDFGSHGFSAEGKRVRLVTVLVPVEGSGSDTPSTAVTTVLDPYGDYDD